MHGPMRDEVRGHCGSDRYNELTVNSVTCTRQSVGLR
jgi:hypothetical protein